MQQTVTLIWEGESGYKRQKNNKEYKEGRENEIYTTREINRESE